MNPNKPICAFYLKGHCRFGDKCKNFHPPNQGSIPMTHPGLNPNPILSQPSSHNCTFFLKNSCTKKDCYFFHGYCDRLEYVKTIDNHNKEINNLLNMDDIKFISSDEQVFYIRNSGNDDNYGETIAQGYKIGKLIYSSDKVICAIQKEGM